MNDDNFSTMFKPELGDVPELRRLALLTLAKTGDVGVIEEYIDACRDYDYLAEDKRTLVAGLVEAPQDFPQKQRLFDTLTREDFDFQTFFADRPNIGLGKIFGLYKVDPTPETAMVGAVLASEFLRLKLLDNLNYKIDLADVFKDIESGEGSLRHAAEKTSARDSVIAVQNALVGYVYEKGRTIPINRGAAILYYMENDIEAAGNQDAVNLWTRKIRGFREGSRYSATTGEKPYVKPQYNL